MRQSSRLLFGSALFAGSLFSWGAGAQVDVNPPAPNVLLLVDSSGSMEYKASSAAFPVCDPTKDDVSEKSRWIDLVEVMTGSIEKYRCEAVDRSSSAFTSLYSLSSVNPADWFYTNPYHRPMHEKCMPAPGTLPANAFDWPTDPIVFKKYDNLNDTCDFKQLNDGLLDDGAFRKNVRFGLMTFDSSTDAGKGYTGTSTPAYADGVDGTWSYFVSGFKQGKPAACSTLQDQEVGARNGAAPPWEGRMVNFGPPTATPTTRNDRIQQVLLGTRPFGATPVAGMLDDARDFLWNDTSTDPVEGGDYGPKSDPYIAGGCRNNFIILLSDGEPNMDLRPHCEGAGPPAGVCPYQKPEEIAYDLANAADAKKKTPVFVIGFAVSNVTLSNSTNVDCKNLTVSDLTAPAGLCAQNPNESQLQACCVLNRIAYNGGTDRAYFANDKDELRAALSSILSGLSASSTSRTLPVFTSTGGGGGTGVAGFRVYSSFKPVKFNLWSGILERQRVVCEVDPLTSSVTPTPQPLDKTKGDDFAWNVNSGKGPERMFWTVIGSKDNGKESERSVRPNIGSTDVDGMGTQGGQDFWSNKSGFAALIPKEAMEIQKKDCTKGVSDEDCRDRIVDWLTGKDTTSSYSRCPSPGSATCNLVGDIFHSTPRVVSRPVEFLRDESYTIFSLQQAKRHTMLYTSTNDGFLHGFKLSSGDPANDTLKVDNDFNNELWAFLPPAVLSSLKAMYPPTHQTLLDGVPVVADVVSVIDPSPPASLYKYKFERSPADAQAGAGKWRTVMVQSFGGSRGGYFAMDITDPVVPQSLGSPDAGPQFLWQLTEAHDGKPLFGRNGSTPLITTLYFNTSATGDPKEVAVAVLPGGDDPDGPISGEEVTRKDDTPDGIDPLFPVRSKVPKYKDGEENHAARSLSIVRLDTGEVVRSFWAKPDKAPGGLKGKNRVIEADIDSPITGVPVAFPGTTGAVSDRIFVGDRDGGLWRIDVSSANPDNWSMKLFFDAYSAMASDAGQPVQTPPMLSVDLLGNVTVAFSTGDQDTLIGQVGQKNFIYSLTEKLNAAQTGFEAKANWFTTFDDGERVTGPLSLFNGSLFFTTYKPESSAGGAACGQGSSRVWGVDYILPKTTGSSIAALDDGGKERMPNGGSFVQYLDNTSAMLANAGIIFGVGVAQLPSCNQETTVPDDFAGNPNHTTITSISPGKFQLVMQVSGQGNVNDNSQTARIEIDLPTPPATSRIDSWAAIVE